MKRSWTNIKELEPQILEMRAAGKTRRQIADNKEAKPSVKYLAVYHHRSKYIYFYSKERIQLKTKLTPLEKRRQLA